MNVQSVMTALRGMTQRERKEIAAAAGVSWWTLQKYAMGQVIEPSAIKIEKIADALSKNAPVADGPQDHKDA